VLEIDLYLISEGDSGRCSESFSVLQENSVNKPSLDLAAQEFCHLLGPWEGKHMQQLTQTGNFVD